MHGVFALRASVFTVQCRLDAAVVSVLLFCTRLCCPSSNHITKQFSTSPTTNHLLWQYIIYVPDIESEGKLKRINSAYFPYEFCSHGQDKSISFIIVSWNGVMTLKGKPVVFIKLQCNFLTLNPRYFIANERHQQWHVPYIN